MSVFGVGYLEFLWCSRQHPWACIEPVSLKFIWIANWLKIKKNHEAQWNPSFKDGTSPWWQNFSSMLFSNIHKNWLHFWFLLGHKRQCLHGNNVVTISSLKWNQLDWTPLKTNTISREAPLHPDTGFSAQRHENWTENEPNISSVFFALIVEYSIDSPAGILDFSLSLCGIKVLVIGLYSPHFQVNGHFVMVACTFPIQSEIQSVIWIYICSNFININIFVPKIKNLYFQ